MTEIKIQILCDHVDHTRFHIVEKGCQMVQLLSAQNCWTNNVRQFDPSQSLKSGKTRKSGLVPMSKQEKLTDLSLIFPTTLETWLKVFRSYYFIKRSRNEAFKALFSQFYQTVAMETMTFRKISISLLAMYFQVL